MSALPRLGVVLQFSLGHMDGWNWSYCIHSLEQNSIKQRDFRTLLAQKLHFHNGEKVKQEIGNHKRPNDTFYCLLL